MPFFSARLRLAARLQAGLPILTLAALLGGCKDRDGDTPVDSDTDVTTRGCTDDTDCDAGEICEDEDCVDGDRDAFDSPAATLYQDQAVEGEIAPEDDIDYFVYNAVGPEWIRVETAPDEDENGLDTVVAIYNATNGALHAYMDDYPTGNVSSYDTVLYAWLPTAGEWVVTVQNNASFYDDPDLTPAEGDYTVTIKQFGRFTDETDALDDPSVAFDIDSDTTTYAVGVVLEEPGDADYIEFTLPWDRAPIEIFGHVDIPGSDSTSLVEVVDPLTGALLLSKDQVGPDGIALYFETLEQQYVARATDADGGGSENHWYVLYFHTRTEGYYGTEFEVEPNDSMPTPQTLPTQSDDVTVDGTTIIYEYVTFTGTFDADGDHDWFAIDADAGDYATIYCSADYLGSQVDPMMEVWGPDGTLLDTVSDGNDLAPDVSGLGPVTDGYLLVDVSAEGGVTSGPSAYYRCTAYLAEVVLE